MARKKALGLKLTPQQEKLWETLLFIIKVLILSIPLYFIILLNVSLLPLQSLDASASSGILRALGYRVEQAGALITVGSENAFTFFLSEDCTAWKSFLFLFALVFAVPGFTFRRRLLGLLAGIPILWLGNQARIVGVVLTERATDVQFAMLTHDYFWRVFLVALVLIVWIAWMKCPCCRLCRKSSPAKARPGRKRKPKLITRKTKRRA